MNRKTTVVFQIFSRIALAASFLSAVADRFGFWGKPGDAQVVWGNWAYFVSYSQTVNSYAGPQFNQMLALAATMLEILLPLLLLAGYKTKYAALISGVLLSAFAVSMTCSLGIKPSLDYSVWTAAAAAFLLSTGDQYPYSIDWLIAKRQQQKSARY